eukprot:357554-Chlamydomonas_euryale.AAC.17
MLAWSVVPAACNSMIAAIRKRAQLPKRWIASRPVPTTSAPATAMAMPETTVSQRHSASKCASHHAVWHADDDGAAARCGRHCSRASRAA